MRCRAAPAIVFLAAPPLSDRATSANVGVFATPTVDQGSPTRPASGVAARVRPSIPASFSAIATAVAAVSSSPPPAHDLPARRRAGLQIVVRQRVAAPLRTALVP